MNVSDAVMKTYAYTLIVESAVAPDFIDITRKVEECIRSSGILNGIVVVFSRHTTAAIVIQENEPLLIEDFKGLLESFAPTKGNYRHNDFDVRTVHMLENECIKIISFYSSLDTSKFNISPVSVSINVVV